MGQEAGGFKYEAGISSFNLELNSCTVNPVISPKFVPGPYLLVGTSKLKWINHIEFGRNRINDETAHIIDSYHGKCTMTEFSVSTGCRYTFLNQEKLIVKPFIESDLFYSGIVYKGKMSGGYSGEGMIVDDKYSLIGVLIRPGLEIQPVSRITITVSPSIKYGTGNKTRNTDDRTEKVKIVNISLVNICLGYSFGKN